MKDTIIINLFAGPGAGKSTGAAYIFSKLKMMGVDAEYVTEFAKDKVWENNKTVFSCQLYISGKQTYKMQRCIGKVDVIVTDSPTVLGAMYNSNNNPYLSDCLIYEFKSLSNKQLNFFIKRKKDYNPNGRNQTKEEAIEIDEKTKQLLNNNGIPFVEIDGNEEGYQLVINSLLSQLKQ